MQRREDMTPSTPETELLRLCTVNPLPAARRERIKALAGQGLDWERFYRLAYDHRVFALVHKALSLSAPEAVPAPWGERLRNLYFQNLNRNLAAEKDLVRLLQALDESGIGAIPYKGPVLAELAYGDVGLRQFNDLDVLVREWDLDRAVFVLESLGYHSSLPESPSRLKRFKRVLRDFAFYRPNETCPVEIQWRLAQNYHPLFHRAGAEWRNLREETLAGFPVKTLSWPDAILVLCHHGLYHSWQHLQMVSDVAQAAAAATGMDWGLVVEDARRRGGQRTLLLGLLLARDLLELELPREISEAAGRDPFVEHLAARMSAGFFEPSSYLIKARSFFFLEARMIGGPLNRARYIWGRLSTPNEEDREALALPGGLFVFHPVLRFVRLFKKYFLKT